MSRSPAWCQLNPQVIRDKLVTETWVQQISTSHAGWSMCDHVPDVGKWLRASFDHICFSLTTFGHFFGLLGVGLPLIISHFVIRKAYLVGRHTYPLEWGHLVSSAAVIWVVTQRFSQITAAEETRGHQDHFIVRHLWVRCFWPKIAVWISEIFVYRMERYFPPCRTDLAPFPLGHIIYASVNSSSARPRRLSGGDFFKNANARGTSVSFLGCQIHLKPAL